MFNEKKIVFVEHYPEAPAFSFALNPRNLWFMKHETNQLRIVSFSWNHDEQITDAVRDQLFTLPEGLTIKREPYSNEAVKEKMTQNLMEKIWPDHHYASPDIINRLKNSQLSQV